MNTNVSPRRRFGVPEVKLLISTVSLVTTLAFWSYFANRDRALAAVTQTGQSEGQLSAQLLGLPPMATLQPFNFTSGAVGSQPLRSVGAPAPSRPNNSAPRFALGGSNTRVAPITVTSSSR